MKVAERVLDVTTTFEGERIGMTINTDALAHIMAVLTDLYSDPERAVIREYSTNAFDAHVEAGVTRPIEVTLPTPLAPFFTVRDFGFGLDVEDIREIYSQYGASTKRQSDDVVGMLGLGCKSALTYTDQFTLTGIKDGIGVQVAISRDADGSGSMTIVDQYETDEPSGVEVVVPVKSYNEFDEKSEHFFRFWNEGSVLVNGEAPKRIDGFWVADDLLLTNEVDQSYVVMGNVAYPMSENRNRWNEWPTVAFVPIGAVQFTPSREALQETKLTQATVARIKERVNTEKEAAYIRQIDAQTTRAQALELVLVASKLGLGNAKLTYRGEEVPRLMTAEKDQRFVTADRNKRWRDRGYGWTRQIAAEVWRKTIFLTGYDGADFSAHKRKKVEQWAFEQNIDPKYTYFVMLDKIPADVKKWIDPSQVHPWSGPAAVKIKVERNATTDRGRVSGSYKAWTHDGYVSELLATDIDTSKPVFYSSIRGGFDDYERNLLNRAHSKGWTVVLLGDNRINKFLRDFPAATRLHDALRTLANTWRDKLTDEDRLFIYFITHASQDKTLLAKLDATQINDPEVAKAVNAAKRKDEKLYADFRVYGRFTTLVPMEWECPLDKYPLLTQMNRYATINGKLADDIHLYLNAAHAAREAN